MSSVGIQPKQSLGQNFLTDPNVARNIVAAFALKPNDVVLEIGPGLGVLTLLVQPQVCRLVAIEIDKNLASILHAKLADCANFELIVNDFLKVDLQRLPPDNGWRIIGNIPYHITSPILFKVLEARQAVQDMTLLLQKEVAARIVAKHNCKDYGILSVMSQTFADVNTLLQVPRTVFSPRPKVDSSLVCWTYTDERSRQIQDEAVFRQAVRRAFGQRRKMLRNSLRDFFLLDRLSASELTMRPEQLSVQQWIDLSNRLAIIRTD